MPLSGNKGEWSEVYTLFKLLAEKKLFVGDENQHRIEDLYYPIVQILRFEEENKITYTVKEDIIIETNGGQLIFDKIISSTFSNNLILVDSMLPTIVAEMLLSKFHKGNSLIKDICNDIVHTNPCHFDLVGNPHFYEYKIKRFLLEAALGMVPNTAWDGNYDANGGYIVVRDDGEIICYHIYDKTLFENYLFNTTKLDTPSSSRHGFGRIEMENGEMFFKLNLQVRFM